MHGILSLAADDRFNPKSLANCVLWLRADLSITLAGGNVSSWGDQSGSLHDASQATSALRPNYDTSGLLVRPDTKFVGGPTYLLLAGTFPAGAKTFFCVFQLTSSSAGSGRSLLSLPTSTGLFTEVICDLGGAYTAVSVVADRNASGGNSAGFGAAGSALGTGSHSLLVTWNGVSSTAASSYTITLDGVAQTVVSSSVVARAAADKASLGARVSSTNVVGFPAPSRFYELAMWSRVLSGSELAQVSAYSHATYGL